MGDRNGDINRVKVGDGDSSGVEATVGDYVEGGSGDNTASMEVAAVQREAAV
jgi:hypothetical protein